MDKDKVLEGILTTRLLSGDLVTFMTELLQLNITPSEARTMDIFGDPAIGELVAKVLESKDDAEASQPALQALRDYLAKSSDVTAKDKAEPAPADAEVERKADVAKDELDKNIDDSIVKPEEIKVPELKTAGDLGEMKALFSAMQDKLDEEFASIKGAIADMQATLKENTKDLEVPTTKDADVEQKNFSAEDEAESTKETHKDEGNDMGLRDRKEFDVLRDMIFSLMPEDKKEEWAKKYEEAMECPECEEKKEEFCNSKNFDSESENKDMFKELHDALVELREALADDEKKEEFCDAKNFDDEPDHKDEKFEGDDLKKTLSDLHDALVDLKESLADEDKDESESKEVKVETKAEEKKDEGLTDEEIKAIEEESTNFSQKPADKVDVFSYLYGDK